MKEARKKPRVFPILPGLMIITTGVLIAIFSSTLCKNWIIIGFGVRTFKAVQVVSIGIIIFGAILSAALSMPLIRMYSSEKREREQKLEHEKRQSQVLTDYTEDSTNPIYTRERLQQLRDEMPELGELVSECLRQMDRMDKLQAKQQLLIKTNEALYLNDTVTVLDNVERRICQNFRNIINLCIAADDAGNLDMKKVQKNLNDNKKKLNDSKQLLKASADWINQYNMDSSNDDRSEVENWIAVIRDSLKEE